MWLEGLDDPKLTRLSLAERGAWWGLLMLAGKCLAGGKIMSGGVGLDLDEIADALHIKTNDERQALESMLAKMEKRGSLVWNDNILLVVHYEERQRIPLSSRPEAVAERMRIYRDRKKKREPTPEQKQEQEYIQELGTKYKAKKKELGRALTPEEEQAVKDKVGEQIYGPRETE